MTETPPPAPTAEHHRLFEDRERVVRWKQWGPYMAERAWGTVREDYSASGDAWAYFPHEHARSRAYRWSEDGLAGFCDKGQTLCLALALWNGQDPILKERLYGLTNPQGNHGEDVKEVYYYEDATPTSSYLRFAYKYPQRAFPYRELLDANQGRSMDLGEVELWDVGAFDEGRYFDVTVEYAKVGPNDVFMIITVENQGDAEAPIHVLPHLWFRNTWSWGDGADGRPRIHAVPEDAQGDDPHGETPYSTMRAADRVLGDYFFYVDGRHELLFTENDSNTARLWGANESPPYAKDAFHDVVVGGDASKANPAKRGTKACAWARFDVPAHGKVRVVARLSPEAQAEPFDALEATLAARRREADAFYAHVQGPNLSDDRRAIHRQASAGLIWTLQFYNYDVDTWLRGDQHPPPDQRLSGRNREWRHVSVADVISMPDAWEYPWFAAWDLAFHCVAMSSVDIDQAKAQLKLMVKEWYQHPSGQIPAYEWEFSDLNPPVHAWAAYQIYKFERKQRGKGDRVFLERVFHKLLINFAWWVNKRDDGGNNIFEGGFLGLDNISLFDRSEPLPPGTKLEQADATAWMAMYCLDLMRIALELAVGNSAYEDLASKFFEHFLRIAYALHHAEDENDLPPWDDEEGFYYDILHEGGRARHLRVRSMVGLIPLFAVHVIDPATFRGLDNFRRRFEWFLARYPHLAEPITERRDGRRVLSAVPPERLERVLGHLFDDDKFLSKFGPRSLSKEHAEHPVVAWQGARRLQVDYEPGESTSRMKGGNSNWRGPIWFPTGYLLYRSLLRLDHGLGDTVRIPRKGGGPDRTLMEAADELAARMVSIFERGPDGRRPVFGDSRLFQEDPSFRDKLLFYEYFHAETGEGLGASHQTGWTALVAELVLRLGRHARGQS
jgi:hypothetical protein